MNITMLKRARKLYNVDYIPYCQNRENQRKWIKAIRMLGDKWLLAKSRGKNENASHTIL
jgi:hypothetical protein